MSAHLYIQALAAKTSTVATGRSERVQAPTPAKQSNTQHAALFGYRGLCLKMPDIDANQRVTMTKKITAQKVIDAAASFDWAEVKPRLCHFAGKAGVEQVDLSFVFEKYQFHIAHSSMCKKTDYFSDETPWGLKTTTVLNYVTTALRIINKGQYVEYLPTEKASFRFSASSLKFGCLREIENQLLQLLPISKNQFQLSNAEARAIIQRINYCFYLLDSLLDRNWREHFGEAIAPYVLSTEEIQFQAYLCSAANKSKQYALDRLDANLEARLFSHIADHKRWGHIFCILILTGVRPIEVQRGIDVNIDDHGMLVFVVKNAKAKNKHQGMTREIRVPVDTPWARKLYDMVLSSGPVVFEESTKALADKCWNMTRSEKFRDLKGFSAYVLRHLFISRQKAAGKTRRFVALAAGHHSLASQFKYSRRRACRKFGSGPKIQVRSNFEHQPVAKITMIENSSAHGEQSDQSENEAYRSMRMQ